MTQVCVSSQVPFHEYQELSRLYETAIEQLDLEARARQNPKIAHADYRLYMSLVNTYPVILSGERTAIKPSHVRQNAGKIHRNTAGAFFYAMKAIGAIAYDPGQFNADAEEGERRIGYITANLPLFVQPETFDLRDNAKRAKAREKAKEYRQNLLIHYCESCGSEQMEYDLLPRCKSCGHEHPLIEEVPVNRITITDVTEDDGFPMYEGMES